MAEPLLRPLLGFVGLVAGCALLLAATAALTGERIDANRARRLLATLTELTGSAALAADVEWHDDVAAACPERALLRGTAEGYGGTIHWLAAADISRPAARLSAIRIAAHQETPGIADFLDRPQQGWLLELRDADAAAIGNIDAVTGATITSRALRRALAGALERPAVSGACEP